MDPIASQRINSENKKKIQDKITEIESWVTATPNASERDYVIKQKELEDLCQPIIMGIYRTAFNMAMQSSNQNNNNNDSNGEQPFIEDVD